MLFAVPYLRGRLGQVTCRKALCDCLRGCHFLEFIVALCPFKNKGMLMKVKIMLLNDEIFHR